MNPGNIQPHPDAPNDYIVFKAPPSMENCVDLGYRLVSVKGRYALMTEFVPDEEDLRLMNAGQPVRFMMHLITDKEGKPVVPPIAIWGKGEDEI